MIDQEYTTQLGAGLGMIEETLILLDIYRNRTDRIALYKEALQSGRFPNMSARRVRNFVVECFAPRYMINDGAPAALLKRLNGAVSNRELSQLMFVYTCRANDILGDFVREVYWNAYSSSRENLSNDEALEFVIQANRERKTSSPWGESVVRRVSAYLTGCCANFGLLEQGRRRVRKILTFRIAPRVATILAYDLHFSGYGDNRVLLAPEWSWFGLDTSEVLDELKLLALKGFFIIQTGGGVVRIEWRHKTMEDLTDALTDV